MLSWNALFAAFTAFLAARFAQRSAHRERAEIGAAGRRRSIKERAVAGMTSRWRVGLGSALGCASRACNFFSTARSGARTLLMLVAHPRWRALLLRKTNASAVLTFIAPWALRRRLVLKERPSLRTLRHTALAEFLERTPAHQGKSRQSAGRGQEEHGERTIFRKARSMHGQRNGKR